MSNFLLPNKNKNHNNTKYTDAVKILLVAVYMPVIAVRRFACLPIV